MNLSHVYGVPPSNAVATALLHRAFDLGIRHFDTAALYGFGNNEKLLGEALKPYRNHIYLASKCGMTGVDGKRVIDGRPETLMATVETALKCLQTDHIDLYYLHRWDRSVPIEDSIGAMSLMVAAGKVGAVGLCEISAETLRRAHAIHPISAVQTEYSLWTRNAEVAVLDACREIGAALVAFSPLGRGFLAGVTGGVDEMADNDIRRNMPRFQEPHFSANLKFLPKFRALSVAAECSMAQLALAWLLHKAEHIIAIPGTTSVAHLEENSAACRVKVSEEIMKRLELLINSRTVSGSRYPPETQREIDTEEV